MLQADFDKVTPKAIVKEKHHPGTGPFTLLSAGSTWSENSNVEEVHGYALAETGTQFPNRQTRDEIEKAAQEKVPADHYVFLKDSPSVVGKRGLRPRVLARSEWIRDGKPVNETYSCWKPHPITLHDHRTLEFIGFAELPMEKQGFSKDRKMAFEDKVGRESLNTYWEIFEP